MNPVYLLTFAIGIVGSNSLMLSPLAGEVAASFGTTPPGVMVASAIYGAATAVSALLLAPSADRIGLRTALVVALVCLTVGLSISAFAPNLATLCLAQAVAGVAAGVCLPATYGLAADLAPPGRESETLGKVLTGWTLSLVAGVSLSAILADILHWRLVFAALAVVGAGVAWSLRHVTVAEAPTAGPQLRTSPLTALGVPGIGVALLSVAAYMVAFYGLYAFLGAHLHVRLGLSTAVTGLSAVAYGLGFGGVVPLDRLIDRYGADKAGPVIFLLLAFVYLALAVSQGSALAIILVCGLWGACNHLGLNLLVGRLTSLDPSQRAAIMGLYSAVTYAAMFVGTISYESVFVAFGFFGCALVSAACVLPALAAAAIRTSARAPV